MRHVAVTRATLPSFDVDWICVQNCLCMLHRHLCNTSVHLTPRQGGADRGARSGQRAYSHCAASLSHKSSAILIYTLKRLIIHLPCRQRCRQRRCDTLLWCHLLLLTRLLPGAYCFTILRSGASQRSKVSSDGTGDSIARVMR